MFYPKNPKCPNGQSANMAQNVSNIMYFKKNQVCKMPPRGGGTNVFLARGLLSVFCDDKFISSQYVKGQLRKFG